MIITIDGPAGTGKSTVARAVAEQLRFDFLDTGAMYRAVALEAVRRNADMENHRELAFVARHCRIEFKWDQHPPAVLLNHEPVGSLLRSNEVTRAASKIAVVQEIRSLLVQSQRGIGRERQNLVTEGRDQGTVVFPDARLKFFLDASPQERARRRLKQLHDRGEIVEYQSILDQIMERDERDRSRPVAPMVPAADAIRIDSTHMTEAEVVKQIVGIVKTRTPAGSES